MKIIYIHQKKVLKRRRRKTIELRNRGVVKSPQVPVKSELYRNIIYLQSSLRPFGDIWKVISRAAQWIVNTRITSVWKINTALYQWVVFSQFQICRALHRKVISFHGSICHITIWSWPFQNKILLFFSSLWKKHLRFSSQKSCCWLWYLDAFVLDSGEVCLIFWPRSVNIWKLISSSNSNFDVLMRQNKSYLSDRRQIQTFE